MDFGIIYATNSNTVRRIIISDVTNYDYANHVGLGETLLIADKKLGTDIHSVRSIVENATGKKSPEPLVALVDNSGLVIQMVLADSQLDTFDNLTMVSAYAGVEVGQTYDAKTNTFIRPSKTVPAAIDKLGNLQPEKIIPSEPVEKPK